MPRNAGSTIDIERRAVLDRDGRWHPLDRVTLVDGGLYHARVTLGNPHFSYHERWLLPSLTWSLSRFRLHDHEPDRMDWYIETDLIEPGNTHWRVRDGYIDVLLYEGHRYHVDDADELAEALAVGEISQTEAVAVLDALGRLCNALRGNGYSGEAIIRQYAPALWLPPRSAP